MPVVLTINTDKPQPGSLYQDHTGISYEFPRGKYQKWIIEGEQFIYYKTELGYTGTGVVGHVSDSPNEGKLIAQILDYKPFADILKIKNSMGQYIEPDQSNGKINVLWAQGVRPLAQHKYEEMVAFGSSMEPADAPNAMVSPLPDQQYARAEIAQAVEKYSVSFIMEELCGIHGAHQVTEMPRNNPGFDILIGDESLPLGYVEVKGTQSKEPFFMLSEGERVFSQQHCDQYRLVVVTGIDIARQAHDQVYWHSGSVAPESVTLEPMQWRGRLAIKGNRD